MTTSTPLRIASLLPSLTDICIALGLADNIVAVTHECNLTLLQQSRDTNNHRDIYVITKCGLNPNLTQGEIDHVVKIDSAADVGALSLYPILDDEFKMANPNMVLTQTLCQVCAPSPAAVQSTITACHLASSDIEIHSFAPASLMDVVETFLEVATICGVPERGVELKRSFMEKMNAIQSICKASPIFKQKKKQVLLLEWIDPPYDGGHWIPEMIEWVGCELSKVGGPKNTVKSKEITWDGLYKADPDLVLVACCGFDLKRNVQDAISSSAKLRPLRAAQEGQIYACNGDLNFARPGPELLGGIAVVAACAYQDDPVVMDALKNLDFIQNGQSMEWEAVDVLHVCTEESPTIAGSCGVGDIEDLPMDFASVHKIACEEGKSTYVDPETGYNVFTEVGLKARGRCCGTGCRHCPYNHENVKDKAKKIKQPAFIFEGHEGSPQFNINLDNTRGKEIKVLFFSGGKDSFLSIRATIRKYLEEQREESLCLILLTTFDAESRIVAHQEIPIETIEKQARHLNIPLLGVPLHRASSESYVDRLLKAFDIIQKRTGGQKIDALVFGDLHLETIRQWRDNEFQPLGIRLEYPLWQVSYNVLEVDLKQSSVGVNVSASTVDWVEKDEDFNEDLMSRARRERCDTFGENGEFHTVVKVWKVSREQALGLTLLPVAK